MRIVCCDLEGVYVPEIWINVAKKTGIEELKLTTRDISDYDVLMRKRLKILEENNLKLKDIQDVIATLSPLDGAKEFMDWLRSQTQVIVVSDTFQEFAGPLMKQLGYPTILCHSLVVDAGNNVVDYKLRQPNAKQMVVEALQGLKYEVTAFGDSYNDTNMLMKANHGILFCPPQNVIDEFPQFPVVTNYDDLKKELKKTVLR